MLLRAICTAALIACACGNPSTVTGAANPLPAPTTYVEKAGFGVQTMQQWYTQSSGLYASPTGWWNSANAITVLVNYSRVANTSAYLNVISNTFNNASKAAGTANFINDYDDDEGWWAMAWIDAYDLTGTPAYLSMGQTIFADIATQWNTTTCGGGVWWNKRNGGTYKNAIANELFLEVAASLANRVSDPAQKAQYQAWAEKEWQWFKGSGMINSKNLVNDGLNSTNPNACTNNNRKTWSYNQGVILGGLVELYKADKDSTLLPTAQAIASATIANLTNSAGILVDSSVTGSDAPQFKGVFLRNLMALYIAAPDPKYKTFADANADSIWTNDMGTNYQFGASWQGPFDSGDATRQSSALEALIAAAAMQ